MLLATVVLSAALAPQAPPAEPLPPEPPPAEAASALEAAPMPRPEEPPPALAVEAAPALAVEPPPASSSLTQEHIDAGLKAFIRGRFSRAQGEFELAYDADPQSAAAAFYLGYACYKLGEPSHRMGPDKRKAKELFAKAYSLDPAFIPVWRTKTE